MRTRGVKLLDPLIETFQIDWLLLPVAECPREEDEIRVISSQFRKPHKPWGHSSGSESRPVCVRRSSQQHALLSGNPAG